LKNLEIYEVIPIVLFVDMKNLKKFIEVAHKIMLEKFNSFACLFLNKPIM
jgi:hypothetical protein